MQIHSHTHTHTQQDGESHERIISEAHLFDRGFPRGQRLSPPVCRNTKRRSIAGYRSVLQTHTYGLVECS